MSITIDGGDRAAQDRVLAALRELVAVARSVSATAELHERPVVGNILLAPAEPALGGAGSASSGGSSRGSAPAADGWHAPIAGAPRPGRIDIDPGPRTVARDGWPLHLPRLEYDLLLFLARHPRQVFSRVQLLTQVWGHTHTTLRTVDVHVSRLRGKLDGQELITTVYGLGYRLADDALVTVAR